MSVAQQPNPLSEGLSLRRRPDPCILVIFGASGDLTSKKLMPALYSLAVRHLLPEKFGIIGAARSEETDEGFQNRMKQAVKDQARDPYDDEVWSRLAAGMRYTTLDFADDKGEDDLRDTLNDLDSKLGTQGNRVYYFAVPPAAIGTLVAEIAERRGADGWIRLIIEKPFGHDLASAEALNTEIQEHFAENEVFRIDHYLGKETVQNMLALRFANGIFEPIWNRQFIDHVQITVAESIGIEGRAGYYEQAGAIRDIFQNHLLQLVALTAMEPPIDFTADSVRNEKVKVLKSMHTPGPKHVVRGQYGPGFVEGEEVRGYREEDGVAHGSLTETFVAAKLFVDNWRWADTPFYVRMGKRLARRETTIAIQFKRAPHPPFDGGGEGLRPNVLLIHVQPNEGVSLAIGAKVPGQGMTIRTVHMDFLYGGAFREGLPDAYERLILDAMLGDATLFTRSDEIEEQWALVDAIVAFWQRDRPSFPNYPAGTWGPASADELLHRDWAVVAPALIEDSWTGEDTSISEIEQELARLRDATAAEGAQPNLRTSVMTHIAWAPPAWQAAAEETLAGMAERHPSRTLLLVPRPDAPDGLDAQVSLRCFPIGDRAVCGEVIELILRGNRASVPASLALPLLISDLPVFLRWRGRPEWGSSPFEQLIDVVDRLVVDSTEWTDLPEGYAGLVELFPRVAVSDIAWERTERWRSLLASLWPEVGAVQKLRVHGTAAQGHLLAGWLRTRLGHDVELELDEHETLEAVDLDGVPAPFPPGSPPHASDVLSSQLDRFGRDPVYEDAVRGALR